MGVLVQALPQVNDLLLEGLHPPLILLNEAQDCRLGSRRYLVPEFNRNRRNRWYTNILRPSQEQTSQGVNGYSRSNRLSLNSSSACF